MMYNNQQFSTLASIVTAAGDDTVARRLLWRRFKTNKTGCYCREKSGASVRLLCQSLRMKSWNDAAGMKSWTDAKNKAPLIVTQE
jgi:hypothetical protein